MAMSLPLALAQGTMVGGHYIVGPLINSGGFGAVYRGTDTSEGNRPCAIKETYDVTPAARRQALMEAGVLFTVRSEHLPAVYDAFEANGRFYLVMQLIEGQNLSQLLRQRVGAGLVGLREPHERAPGPCSEQEVCSWLLPIMDVLQELHSRKTPVLHRDIKPANIILTPKQTTVLVDFGLTKLYDPNVSTQTMVKAVSEGFSPIEQYVGKTSPQSDVYAMAATMYLLLTNRLPQSSINRGVQDNLIPPRQLNPTLSPKMERVLLKALSLYADDRYSMGEFAEGLREPGFTAFSDPTDSFPPFQAPTQTQASPPLVLPAPPSPSPTPSASPSPAVHAYSGTSAGKLQPPPKQAGAKSNISHAPLYPQQPAAVPPGFVMVPPVVLQPVQNLPGAFGQGCLWGLIQGIVGAWLVLAHPTNNSYFVLATFLGFVFYIIAGLLTTRKGGSSIRGAWAGMWAGIDSTIVFWVVLYIGLIWNTFQKWQHAIAIAQEDGRRLSPGAFDRIWREGLPNFMQQLSSSGQQGGLLTYVLIGLAVAFSLGWVGGMISISRYKARLAKQQYP
jgi:serine/threonine protein kinase